MVVIIFVQHEFAISVYVSCLNDSSAQYIRLHLSHPETT